MSDEQGVQSKARGNLFTASDLARFCEVDLKTIHNWCDRNRIEHFRTPGRHLRFERAAVVAFLGRYGYPIPAELAAEATTAEPSAAPSP